jgi:hypothetical protein
MNDAEILKLLEQTAQYRLLPDPMAPAINELKARLAALKPMPHTKIVLVDFDGVLHSYKTGWAGAAVVADEPLPGAIRWLASMVRDRELDVRIFSARCNDPVAIPVMRDWLVKHQFPEHLLEHLTFQPGKPKAHLIIDDRAWLFKYSGAYGYDQYSRQHVLAFEPWYYSNPDWKRK